MRETMVRLALVLGTCLGASGCGTGERYVVSQSSNQMMVIDMIDRKGPEPTARITIISSKPELDEFNDRLIRRLSFETRFNCADGAMRYGASVARLESGSKVTAPESGAVWEHPAPATGKANAIRVVCEPSSANVALERRSLDRLERDYRE